MPLGGGWQKAVQENTHRASTTPPLIAATHTPRVIHSFSPLRAFIWTLRPTTYCQLTLYWEKMPGGKFQNKLSIGLYFFIHTLQYQVTFAYSWGDSYIIRVTSAIRRSKRNKRAFRKFTSPSIHVLRTLPNLLKKMSTLVRGFKNKPTALIT